MISPPRVLLPMFFFLPFWGVSVKVSVLANISEVCRILPLHFQQFSTQRFTVFTLEDPIRSVLFPSSMRFLAIMHSTGPDVIRPASVNVSRCL